METSADGRCLVKFFFEKPKTSEAASKQSKKKPQKNNTNKKLLITFLSKTKSKEMSQEKKTETRQIHVLKNILWTNQTKKQKLLPYKNRKKC